MRKLTPQRVGPNMRAKVALLEEMLRETVAGGYLLKVAKCLVF